MSSIVMPRRLTPLAIAALALLAGPTGTALAAAVTDGSVGAVQTLSGAMVIPQTLGTVRGTNLFQSFARFGIAVGESATFTTTDPGLRHVITRVTGGEASLLQGPLSLLAGGGARPDFWLVNPSGVMVGAGASFNVPAGLHISTAPQLLFADGTVWATGSPSALSMLSVAAPESFGFLAAPAAALRWQDSNVTIATGAMLALTGGEIAIDRATLVAPGGEIRLQAPGAVRIGAQALLAATAPLAGDAGRITVDAGSMRIDGSGALGDRLLVQTGPAGSGSGITLRLAGALEIGSGSRVFAISAGLGGGITVTAARLSADGGLVTSLNTGGGPGPAITLDLQGALELTGGASIGTATLTAGAAGDLFVRAAFVRLDGAGPLGVSGLGTFGGRPGALTLTTPGTLELRQGAGITSQNLGTEAAGAMLIQAGRLVADGGGVTTGIVSESFGSGPAAAVSVEVAGATTLINGGIISTSTVGGGDGGSLRVRSDTLSLQGGSSAATGIVSDAPSPLAGRGGAIAIDTRLLDVVGNAQIASLTGSAIGGAAGDVTVRADRVTLDGGGAAVPQIVSFAIGTLGDAGRVRVQAREQLVMRGGAGLLAASVGGGSPGMVDVETGTLLIDGRGAGAGVQTILGGGGLSGTASAAAAVNVQAQQIELREGGVISSVTTSPLGAGAMQVRADTLLIDGGGNAQLLTGLRADTIGSGNAGSITIAAREITVRDGGAISTSTFGTGRGGNIIIGAERMTLERSGGVSSFTVGAGNAGRVSLDIGDTLTLAQGGVVVANTAGGGAAGRIDIHAGHLVVGGTDSRNDQRSGIASRALPGSGGQTGNITIAVDGALELQPLGILTIANFATVADPAALTPTTLALRAGSLNLEGAEITAAASGNARAGSISIDTPGRLRAAGSSISTTAVDGDGGAIRIAAASGVLLKNSSVTTSVSGTTNGNGGDITITGDWLALASGFVQANTTAPRARGGNVAINVGLLVPDGSNVFIGGSRIVALRAGAPGYNVIQAAAPDGLAGQLELSRPELNLAGSLVALLVPVIDFGLIGRDMCAAGTDSSFTVLGSGALPAAAAAPLRISPLPR